MLIRSRSVAVFVKAVRELVREGKQLGLAYDQVGVLFHPWPMDLLTSTSTARIPNSPLHLHRNPLWLLSRYLRGARHDPIANRRSICAELHTAHTRRRSVRGYASRTRPLRLHVSEVATPSQAAADIVKALGGVGPDSESATTGVALEWIGRALAEVGWGEMVRMRGRTRTRRCTSSRLS